MPAAARFRPFRMAGTTYQEIYQGFRWRVPRNFNIGTACTDAQPPDRLALIDVSDGERRYSFGELTELTNRMANALIGLGLETGDRIAVVLPQIAATAVAHVGAYKAGMISVPLSTLFGADALRYRLADSGARLVVTDREGAERIAALDGVPDLRTCRGCSMTRRRARLGTQAPRTSRARSSTPPAPPARRRACCTDTAFSSARRAGFACATSFRPSAAI